MRRWVHRQLAASLKPHPAGPVVVLDPEHVLSDFELDAIADDLDVRIVQDWVQLRALWDVEIRRHPETTDIVLVRSAEFNSPSDLPWDIEHEATSVIKARWPVPAELRDAFRSAPEFADHLADAAKSHSTVGDILSEALDYRPGDPASELNVVARLRTDPATPAALWTAVAGYLKTDLAHKTAAAQGDITHLQEAWNDWVARGDASAAHPQLEAAPGALTTLLAAGLLAPAPGGTSGLPAWTAIGIAEPDPQALLAELLAQRPAAASTITDWIDTAAWWGTVRAAAAQLPVHATGDHLWKTWAEIDSDFQHWLRRSYGSSLQSAAPTPRALHQVAPFLARRVEDGAKVLLVIIDGLGFAQWTRVRAASGIHVEESTGCLAMIPTLTTVSRQAILAGCLPADFSETLTTTSAEPRRWMSFWKAQGLPQSDVTYVKTLGATPDDVPALTGVAVAVVVNAVDEILHGAEVLGDQQVATSVDLWARTGFLNRLVDKATAQGYEVWLTSDHGNIPTIAGSVPREGQVVEAAGTRVRLYPNQTLRQQAREHGSIWDPPGLPGGKLNPLFADGRRGYHSVGVRVSHGGTSLDEVIVPFVKVAP